MPDIQISLDSPAPGIAESLLSCPELFLFELFRIRIYLIFYVIVFQKTAAKV